MKSEQPPYSFFIDNDIRPWSIFLDAWNWNLFFFFFFEREPDCQFPPLRNVLAMEVTLILAPASRNTKLLVKSIQHLLIKYPGCESSIGYSKTPDHNPLVASKVKVLTWKLFFTGNGAGSISSRPSIHPGCISGYSLQKE